ncbi:MAG: hypothetical protein KKE86_01255 [Planctomycetes bacterium]|nr:hypothetical protein [Planctomycetota bacterium]
MPVIWLARDREFISAFKNKRLLECARGVAAVAPRLVKCGQRDDIRRCRIRGSDRK